MIVTPYENPRHFLVCNKRLTAKVVATSKSCGEKSFVIRNRDQPDHNLINLFYQYS